MSKLELVVHQNDVRRLDTWRAGHIRQRRESIAHAAANSMYPWTQELGDRGRAGARETGHVTLAGKCFPVLLRERQATQP